MTSKEALKKLKDNDFQYIIYPTYPPKEGYAGMTPDQCYDIIEKDLNKLEALQQNVDELSSESKTQQLHVKTDGSLTTQDTVIVTLSPDDSDGYIKITTDKHTIDANPLMPKVDELRRIATEATLAKQTKYDKAVQLCVDDNIEAINARIYDIAQQGKFKLCCSVNICDPKYTADLETCEFEQFDRDVWQKLTDIYTPQGFVIPPHQSNYFELMW